MYSRLKEFDDSLEDKNAQFFHHEQSRARFKNHLISLVSTTEEPGNPFEETVKILFWSCTTIRKIDTQGKEKYAAFVREQLIDQTKLLEDISGNNLSLKTSYSKTNISKDKLKLKSSRTDCQLFAKLYIACQIREGKLDEFFSY